jgi:branched-chain amino acid transport system ATP-binding protein
MSSAPALTVDELNAWYGAAQVLYAVSLTVSRGEVVALMGRNGAGKSTTMKAIMGLIPRRSGVVRVDGDDTLALRSFEIARLGVGFTPEDRRIFSDLTVLENLEIGQRKPKDLQFPAWSLDRVFDLFPNLAEKRHQLGAFISGGEQQMLSIARTLMGNPRLLLLDEPSEGVAPVVVEQLANTLLLVKQQGLSILLSEQNVAFAQILADRAYMLEKGQIRWTGNMHELVRDPELQRSYLAL